MKISRYLCAPAAFDSKYIGLAQDICLDMWTGEKCTCLTVFKARPSVPQDNPLADLRWKTVQSFYRIKLPFPDNCLCNAALLSRH